MANPRTTIRQVVRGNVGFRRFRGFSTPNFEVGTVKTVINAVFNYQLRESAVKVRETAVLRGIRELRNQLVA